MKCANYLTKHLYQLQKHVIVDKNVVLCRNLTHLGDGLLGMKFNFEHIIIKGKR